jgi:hypothetical protein
MMALSKAYDLVYQFAWSAADQATNNAFEMAAPPASLNLYPDSLRPARP